MDASHLPNNINELTVSNSRSSNSSGPRPVESGVVHESATTRVIRRGPMGIKALIDPSQSTERRLQLVEHEQKISRSLPFLFPHRKVFRVGLYQDYPAVYFEWVEGVTVGEWLSSQPPQAQETDVGVNLNSYESLDTRLQVALAITKAVCDFHEAKLLHCHLNFDNIILDFSRANNCTAVLIDYSNAVSSYDSMFHPHDVSMHKAYIESKKQQDLYSLGVVLFTVLNSHIINVEQGQDEVDSDDNVRSVDGVVSGDDAEERRNKRGKSQQLQPTNHLPLYLVSLVSSLLQPAAVDGSTDKCQYKSAREVFKDLLLASKKPDIYLRVVQNLTDLLTSPLILPKGSFYGRTAEMSMLQSSFDFMMEGNPKSRALIVTGHAGTGKTTLLNQLTKQLKQSNGHMIVCKFTENDNPDMILASGFDSFFKHILESNNESARESLKIRIQHTLGNHVAALDESLTHLALLLGRQGAADNGNDTSALKLRWKFLLTNLVHAISSQTHPIVLLFEDLHWASDDTLDTVKLIMTDSKIRYCLFCMSYRDTNASMMPKLFEMNEELQSRGVSLLSIKLGPIEKESVDSLVSELLCMPPTISKPLSSVICNKTGGTILFVTNLLRSLHEEKLIYFSLTTLSWEFDLDGIIKKEISSDVLNFLKERMSRLSASDQDRLKIAACLGSTFDLSVFQRASKTPSIATDDFVSFATENGYLQELSPRKLRWSHDQLQAAAYSLIPLNKRETTHLLLGTRIYMSAESGELPKMIHDIVRNMNIGVRYLRTQVQRTELANLNLVAGEQSKKSSSFYSALKYFMTGIELLENDWRNTSYDLGMKLFNSAIHMMIITGEVTTFESTILTPLLVAKNFEDRLPAHFYFIRFLFLSGRVEEAVENCFTVLAEFGEEFPSQVTPDIIQAEINKTDMLLANFPADNLESLPQLTDQMELLAMEFMKSFIQLLYRTKYQYVPLVGCRLVQRSLSRGWCFYSAFGLYFFGHSLIGALKKVDDGFVWVKMGLKLIRQITENGINADGSLPVIESMYYAQISFLKEPVQATCEALHGTYRGALMEGQIEYAMYSSFHSCRHGFMCGLPLAELSNVCTSVAHEMARVKQVSTLMELTSHHCMILKLMGKTDVSQVFSIFNGMHDEDGLLELATSKGDQFLVQCLCFNRLYLAFWFKNYEEAIHLAEQYGNSQVLRFLDFYKVFYEGLAALHLAQSKDEDKKKLIDIGEKAVSSFSTWEKFNTWNFENKLLLVSAELCYAKGDYEVAEEKYKASIVSAQNHRFVHEEGLAYEFLGSFYSCVGNTEKSKEMFANAIACYETWGATAVIDQLKNQR